MTAKKGGLSIADVEAAVAEIENLASDPEAAHGREDQLYAMVLEDVAKGFGRHAALAREALKTRELKFERWCA